METGYVQIYTGNGKGKTTAALGLGLRACGRNLKVKMVQFLKGSTTGELFSVKNLKNFSIYRVSDCKKFFWLTNEDEKEIMKEKSINIFNEINSWFINDECDLLILDEIMAAIRKEIVPLECVIKLIETKPSKTEIVLTGRKAPKALIELADLVSEINPVKHYYEKGVKARIGIER